MEYTCGDRSQDLLAMPAHFLQKDVILQEREKAAILNSERTFKSMRFYESASAKLLEAREVLTATLNRET